MKNLATTIVLAAIFCCASIVVAATDQPSALQPCSVGDRYCGIYSVYAAASLHGLTPDFRSLASPEFVSSPAGSTLADVERAARHIGLHAVSLQRMTLSDLRSIKHPVVLLVKSNDDGAEFDHFVLYVEARGEDAAILDPNHPIHEIPFQQLRARWNGMGIVLSSDAINQSGVLAPIRLRVGVIICICAFSVLILRLAPSNLLYESGLTGPRFRALSGCVQATGVSFFAAVIALSYHRLDPSGFLASSDATELINSLEEAAILPKINAEEARKLNENGAVLVDARLPADFDAAHIEGAISVPVGSDSATRTSALLGISYDRTIIVYCQSSRCNYDEDIARGLLRDGFTDVRIFHGGWREWMEMYGDKGSS